MRTPHDHTNELIKQLPNETEKDMKNSADLEGCYLCFSYRQIQHNLVPQGFSLGKNCPQGLEYGPRPKAEGNT